MTSGEWLRLGKDQLAAIGITSAELDCLIFLEDVTGLDRANLIARPETKIKPKQLGKLNAWLSRRLKHEPLSYIRGKSHFYGRQFRVNRHTLEPRPETETIIELLLGLGVKSGQIIDVGTGSGCLAITAKLELPEAAVLASDISSECLKLAKVNAKKLGADIKFFQGDLLEALPTTNYQLPTAILANLPYVPDGWQLNQAANFEPRIAIFGGADGLKYYRKLFSQASAWKIPPNYILAESLPPQHFKLAAVALKNGYKLSNTQDFIQVFKYRV